jgi:molybdenum cofactor cytidylyltransferase
MGSPKLLLPWEGTTVLAHITQTLAEAGIADIVVVTGAARAQVETEVSRLAREVPIEAVYNPDHERGGMRSSIQAGIWRLASLQGHVAEADQAIVAALIALGDQPQTRVETVRTIRQAYASSSADLVVPSFNRRRGHPWLLAAALWDQFMALRAPRTARDFLDQNAARIHYIEVDTPTVLGDIDTPEDYAREASA